MGKRARSEAAPKPSAAPPEAASPAPTRPSKPKWSKMILGLATCAALALWWMHASSASRAGRFGETARSDFIELPSNVSASDLLPVIDPSIFLMWTTPAETFRGRNAAVLDTYLFHHPHARITIYASHLPFDFFSRYTDAGYDVRVERIDDAFIVGLGRVCPGGRWLEDLARWKTGPYYYSHLTDFLRFCLLYRDGGVYSDFDALLLQPLDLRAWGASFIGKDRVRAHGTHADCLWCLPGGAFYLAPGVMGSIKGGALPRAALIEGFESAYDPTVFNAVGPRAVTVAYRSLPATADAVTVLDPHVLYPYSYWQVGPLFNASASAPDDERNAQRATRLARTSHSLHLYGHVSKTLAVEVGSVVDGVVQAHRVMGERAVLVGPEFGEIARVAQRVEGVRMVVGARERAGRFDVVVRVDEGKVAVAGSDRVWHSALRWSGVSAAEVNARLAELHILRPSDAEEVTLSIDITSDVLEAPLRHVMRLLNIRPLLTIMIKTFDRMHKVFSLVETIRVRYPDVRIIVADDGEGAQSYVSASASSRGVHRRDFLFLPLPYDVGLSAGWNRMLARVQTPYFLTLDDDFLFDANSRLDHLLWPVVNGDLDIAAAKNPRDEENYGFDFCGLLRIDNDTLDLVSGRHGRVRGCDVVDIVPNLFVAVTDRLRGHVPWDEALKLGEHEDFFLRVKAANLRVGSCPLASFNHGQEASWQAGVANKYNAMRARIYEFWRLSMTKHGLTRLRSFGTLMMIARPPAHVEDIVVTEVLSRSARVTWRPVDDASRFVLSFHEVTQGSSAIMTTQTDSSTHLLVALQPNTTYVIKVIAGHFLFEETGVTIVFRTRPDTFVGVLSNFGFERGMLPWVSGFGTTFHTVTSAALSGVLSGRLQIHAAAQLSSTPAVMQISQSVAVGRPLGGVLLGAHSRLEQLFGDPREVTYEAQLRVYMEGDDDDMPAVYATAQFSPYTNDWQAVSMHVGVVRDVAVPVSHVEVTLLLGGYRGSAVFDHVVLVLLEEERQALPARP